MAEKTEEQIAREIEAVNAMKNAKSNMAAALERIATLERALTTARDNIQSFKSYVPKGAYLYGGQKSLHDVMDDAASAATKALGT